MSFSKTVFSSSLLNTYPISDFIGRNYVIMYLGYNYVNKRDLLKSISSSFFLIHLELKRQVRLYNPVVPSKAIPVSRPQWTKSTPVFRPKRRKKHTQWGGTYPYGLCKGVFPWGSRGILGGVQWPAVLVRPKTTPSEPWEVLCFSLWAPPLPPQPSLEVCLNPRSLNGQRKRVNTAS